MQKGIAARAADLLDYAARKKPGAPIPWTWVTKYVLGGRILSADSKTVVDMSRRSGGIRQILMKNYRRGLQNFPSVGVRATVDDDDLADTQLRKQTKQHEASRQRIIQTRSLIDTKQMKNKKLRAWVEGGVGALLSAHNDRLAALLLPPGEEPGDKGGAGGPRR
jgi:hypothetical protein